MFKHALLMLLLLTSAGALHASAEDPPISCVEGPTQQSYDKEYLEGSSIIPGVLYVWAGAAPAFGQRLNAFEVTDSDANSYTGYHEAVGCGLIDTDCIYEEVMKIVEGGTSRDLFRCVEPLQ